MSETPPPAPDPRPRARPPWFTTLLLVLGPAALASALVASTGWWVWTTTAGLRAVGLVVNAFVPGVTIAGIDGSLRDGFRVASVAVRRADVAVVIDDVAVEPQDWTPFEARIDVVRLAARRVQIDWVSKPSAAAPPASIGVPYDVMVRHGRIGELAIGARGSAPLVFRQIEVAGQANSETIDLVALSGEFGRAQARGRLRLGALPPFPADADFELTTSWQNRPVNAHLAGTGSLQQLQLELLADDSVVRARATATMRLFEPVFLARLVADVDAFDPSLWLADVPSMQLRAHADLQPLGHAGQALAVAGPFDVENRNPGAIDRDRVPLRSAQGTLTWEQDRLALVIARAEGMKGSASGELLWSSADGLTARLQFVGIDFADLHSRALPTRATGELSYAVKDDEQHIEGSARNTSGLAVSADIVATLRKQVLEVSTGRLRLGEGRADLRGQVELQGARAFQLNGSFAALDLAQAVRGVDTRLNGTFEVHGRLQSPLAGQLNFSLSDSRVAGRPLAGRGRIALADHRFDADVDVQSAAARLTAAGGIGGGRELQVEFSAPDIEPLVPGYRGRVAARVTVQGELEALRLNGSVDGADFALPGGHRVERLQASFAGGQAASDPLALKVELTGHASPSGPDLSVASASLIGQRNDGERQSRIECRDRGRATRARPRTRRLRAWRLARNAGCGRGRCAARPADAHSSTARRFRRGNVAWTGRF